MPNEERIAAWIAKKRAELIDTSRRNRLLYFKPTAAGTLRLTEPDPQAIFHRLMQEEKPWQFYPRDPKQSLDDFAEEGMEDALPPPLPPRRADEIRGEASDKTDAKLRRALYALRQKARSSLEEKGVVTLFLALGLLEWTEADDSSQKIQSPLLLVPVKLEKEAKHGTYKLQLFEESAELNPTLAYKISGDFGLTLPEPPELDALNLGAYFAAIREAVQSKPGWTVTEAAYLGLFSFPKIVILNDPAWKLAADNPLICALAGDASRLTPPPPDLPNAEDLDARLPPQDTFQTRDADSSQQEAIAAARRGVSFVLQGPPGTGKSQTIANIIAECLADGKRVLFVSEKMAALKVVFDRLREDGVSEFCLQAHSEQANKREVVQELGRALNTPRPQPQNGTENFAEFLRLRGTLNAYVAALHQPRPPLGISAFQAHGNLAALESAPDMIFDFAHPATQTNENLTEIDANLNRLAQSHDTLQTHDTHLWRDVTADCYSLQLKTDISVRFKDTIDLLSGLEAAGQGLAKLCGVPAPTDLRQTDNLLHLARLLGRTPSPPAGWFRAGALAPLIEKAQVYQASFEDYRDRRAALRVWWSETLLALPHADLMDALTTAPQPLLARMTPGADAAADRLVSERGALIAALTHAAQLLEQLAQSSPMLAQTCGLNAPACLTDVQELCALAELMLRDPKPQSDWFSRARLLALRTEAEEAKAQYAAYISARDAIAARYDDDFLRLDITGLLTRFSGAYASPLRLLHPGFYADRRAMRQTLRTPAPLSYEEALRDLKAARQAAEGKQWIATRQEAHLQACGRHYEGLTTDWNGVLAALDCCRQLVERQGEGRLPDAMRRILCEPGQAIAAIRPFQESVRATLTLLETRLSEIGRMVSLTSLPFTPQPLASAELTALHVWLNELLTLAQRFNAAYETVSVCRKSGETAPSRTVTQIVADLQEASDLTEIEATIAADAAQLEREYGHLFTGMDTKWEDILAALDWTGSIFQWFGAEPPAGFVALASGEVPGAAEAQERQTAARALRERLAGESAFLFSLFPTEKILCDGLPFDTAPLLRVAAWLQARLDNLPALEAWITFRQAVSQCEAAGLGGFVAQALRLKPAADELRPAFYKRFWMLWLDALRQAEPAFEGFSGARQEAQIAQFRRMDRENIRSAQGRLKRRLLQARPTAHWGDSPTGEAALLQRELTKKSRHKPLRQLFREIPNLLLALKPCLMMSPVSVAQFLDAERMKFDLVVFDEASQIGSEDVIGAIVRGRQLIVVGDNKQLPPSRFFATASVIDEDNTDGEGDAVVVEDYESVLDECIAAGLPTKMLRWHYRSRCEGLIAFSNHHLYEDKLVTFPSPCATNAGGPDACVEFVPVPEGVYQRGKGTNPGEARVVAEMVFRHFTENRGQSLGVIAFSEAQTTAIDDELRRKSRNDLEFAAYLDGAGHEPFFLKNLENVQGDERDVIFFSVGYGRDEAGKLSMNFGPLNRAGGERRLNVAVTRAKDRVKLVSSMLPQDIDTNRTAAKGVALLKNYMEYAQRGPIALYGQTTASGDETFDSPFEREVCRSLQARGVTLHTQVGCSGYKIDLAALDEAHPGRYLLGIECDGATYHSSKTARDRDRLRQEVLENLGWRILRIWSADWVNDREAQIARVMAALAEARHAPLLTTAQAVVTTRDEGESDADVGGLFSLPEQTDDTPPIENVSIPAADTAPENVALFAACDLGVQGTPTDFYNLINDNIEQIAEALVYVVNHEGPIHFMTATRRVIGGWGLTRTGSNLQDALLRATKIAAHCNRLVLRDSFLWPCNLERPVVRIPAEGDAPRGIEEIALEEIAEAAVICLQSAFGATADELITQTARLLGYKRAGVQVNERIRAGIQQGVASGRIIENGDSFALPQNQAGFYGLL